MKSESNVPAIISYLTVVGLIIAFFVGDRNDYYTMHHMNQALVIYIFGAVAHVLGRIPLIGAWVSLIISVLLFLCWCAGIFRAMTSNSEPLPVIGNVHIIG